MKPRPTSANDSRVAACYTRISSTDNELGVTRQLDESMRLAELLELGKTVEYRDNDVSASKENVVRPAWQRLLADMRAGKIKHVVAWAVDRLYRRNEELTELIRIAKQQNVRVTTVTGGELDLGTAGGRFTATVQGAAATYEVEKTRERLLAMKRQYAALGRWGGGRHPFGWDVHGYGSETELTINEREADALRRAINDVLGGKSHRSVTADLNAMRETPMRVSSLRQLLTRPSSAGFAVSRGEIVGRGNWPAIIDEQTHARIVAHFASRAKPGSGRPARKYLGTSLFLCDVCGERVTTTGGTHDARARYVCQFSHAARIVAYTDERVREVVSAYLDDATTVAAAIARRESVDLGPLLVERDRLHDEEKQLVRLWRRKVISLEALEADATENRSRLAEIEAEIAAASDSTTSSILLALDPVAAFDAADLEEQRGLIAQLVSVRLKRANRSRPAGWKFGQPYFDPATVEIAPLIG